MPPPQPEARADAGERHVRSVLGRSSPRSLVLDRSCLIAHAARAQPSRPHGADKRRDVRMGTDQLRRRVSQEARVEHQAHERVEDEQECRRPNGYRADVRPTSRIELAERQREQQQHGAAGKQLHRIGDREIGRSVGVRRQQGARRPQDRREDESRGRPLAPRRSRCSAPSAPRSRSRRTQPRARTCDATDTGCSTRSRGRPTAGSSPRGSPRDWARARHGWDICSAESAPLRLATFLRNGHGTSASRASRSATSSLSSRRNHSARHAK